MASKEKRLADAVRILSNAFKRTVVDSKKKIPTQSHKECQILGLMNGKGKTMSALADECGLTPGSLTPHIDQMEKNKLVKRERDANDRRKVYISLTSKGRKVSDYFSHVRSLMAKKMLMSLSKEEQELYVSLTEKVAQGLLKEANAKK